MKPTRILILAGALPALIGVPVLAQASDWVDIKDPKELRALYSNKTFRGNGWVGHYRADGTGVLIRERTKKPERRTWAVKGNDQVCATPENGATRCHTFKYVSKDRKQVMVTPVSGGPSYIFTVEDGVPKF
jgi:hypothetical protein